MKIYFEVPGGYKLPQAHDTEVSFIPRKGDYIEVNSMGSIWKPKVLRVGKVVFDNWLSECWVSLVEEE